MRQKKPLLHYIVKYRKLLMYFSATIILFIAYFSNKRHLDYLDLKIQCVSADIRITKKIKYLSSLRYSNNNKILVATIIYEEASKRARNNEIEYRMNEFIADTMVESYMDGYADGRKTYDGQL
jgi:hypothetical protein